MGEENQDVEEDRANSLEAEDLSSRVKELEDKLRQRDDEIHDLQSQNEDMEERLERYEELARPLPPTAEVVQAMETSNDRAMRQIYGKEGPRS